MADPYSGVTISGYNANPPADDGSQVEANRVKWATIKTKITDPVKTRTDDMNTALIAAFAKMVGGSSITSTSISYTVLSTDQGKLVRGTASAITITTPDAADVDAPFVFCLLNDSSGDITLDGSGSQTIDGDASVTVPPGCGAMLYTDGTNWFTNGQNFQRTLVEPQGYLTLLDVATSPTSPMPSSSQASKTAVYYRPYKGNLIGIPNGTLFNVREFAELTLTLNSNHVASGIYDCFVFDDAGTIRIGTGTVWSTVTAGSCARGTGAGTTELDLLKGMFVNKVAATMRNGATTYSVAANCGIYVGSIFMDGTNGQISCHVAWGNARKWGVWNAYNRMPVMLKAGSASTSWGNTPTTWRQSAGDANNTLAVFSGLAEDFYDLSFQQEISSLTNATTSRGEVGIGVNSTTVPSGIVGSNHFVNTSASSMTLRTTPRASYEMPPSLGINNINSIEQATSGTTNNTFFGSETFMKLAAKWMA